jgi:hypothetical protein
MQFYRRQKKGERYQGGIRDVWRDIFVSGRFYNPRCSKVQQFQAISRACLREQVTKMIKGNKMARVLRRKVKDQFSSSSPYIQRQCSSLNGTPLSSNTYQDVETAIKSPLFTLLFKASGRRLQGEERIITYRLPTPVLRKGLNDLVECHRELRIRHLNHLDLAADAYQTNEKENKRDIGHYTRLGKRINGTMGFSASIYKRKDDSEIVVAFRGTELSDIRDLITDLSKGRLQFTLKNREMVMKRLYAHVKEIMKARRRQGLSPWVKISFTGHSLGGALAQAFGADLTLRMKGEFKRKTRRGKKIRDRRWKSLINGSPYSWNSYPIDTATFGALNAGRIIDSNFSNAHRVSLTTSRWSEGQDSYMRENDFISKIVTHEFGNTPHVLPRKSGESEGIFASFHDHLTSALKENLKDFNSCFPDFKSSNIFN